MIALLLACGSEPTTETKPLEQPKTPNVVFITMDTTRRDRLGTYGYEPAKTSRIDAFANQGYRFQHTYSSIPLTTPSHASMLTGLYPPHHGIRNNGDAILPDAIQTLPEQLHAHGYQTVASVSAFVTTRIWNLHQGFDHYFDEIETQQGGRWAQERVAASVMDDLLSWFDTERESTKPFFMWAHLYDPHHPHIVHPGYEEIDNTYDAEIAYMNDQIDRLYQHVSNIAPDTIWVLIADHGEAFEGQHGESSHGLFLYEETMAIPWIIQPYPALSETQIVNTPSSVVDVPNTVLGLLELPTLENIDGIDAIAEERTHPVYMESNTVQQRFGYHPEIALSNGKDKLMPTANPHLYDLNTDPNETHNLYTESTASEWSDWVGLGRTLYMDSPRFTMDSPDASVMKQLEALGYMGGNNGSSTDLSAYDIDAKDRLDTITELTDIVKSRRLKPETTPEEIIQRFETLLESEPQLAEARLLLGQTYAVAGRKDDAIRTLEQAMALNPESVVVALNLANQHADLGHFEEGIAILEGVLDRVPNDKGAQSNLLRMLSDSGQHDTAIQRGSQWLEETPSQQLQAILGVILVRNQQWELGTEMLRASLADEIPREHVQRSLGHLALRKQDVQTALQAYEAEIKHFPDPDLQLKIAKIYEQQQNWSASAHHYCAVASARPQLTRAHLNCAQTHFNLGNIDAAETALKPALQMAPEGPFVLLLHANILAKQGHTEEATKIFEKAKILREQQVSGQPKR